MEILRNSSDEVVDSDKFLITEIKPAVKNQNRVNVFVDGKYNFSLDIAQVVDFGIKVGQRLSEEKIAEYKRAQEFGKLYQRALEWCLSRPHSVQETKDYLKRKQMRRRQENFKRVKEEKKPLVEIEDEDKKLVLERLVEKGHVDDRKFAEYYVENRFVKKGISQRRMWMELAKKGINKEIIEEVLESGGRSDEEEIKKIIAKKRSKYDEEKLISYLVRQGFDYQLVQSLVRCEMD